MVITKSILVLTYWVSPMLNRTTTPVILLIQSSTSIGLTVVVEVVVVSVVVVGSVVVVVSVVVVGSAIVVGKVLYGFWKLVEKGLS